MNSEQTSGGRAALERITRRRHRCLSVVQSGEQERLDVSPGEDPTAIVQYPFERHSPAASRSRSASPYGAKTGTGSASPLFGKAQARFKKLEQSHTAVVKVDLAPEKHPSGDAKSDVLGKVERWKEARAHIHQYNQD